MCHICNNSSCNGGGLCGYNNTNGLLCNEWSNSCNEAKKCGCKWLVPSDCVFYTGSVTPCLAITTNTTLTNVIKRFDAAFCNIAPSGVSSGCPITVSGTTGQINVTQTGSGCSSNYQIGLSNVITSNIDTINSQINNISNFLLTTITSITTNTPANLDITNPSTNVWNIDYIPPATGISGILWSDYTDSTTVNTSWTTVKTYSVTATTLSTNGDKLIANTRFVASTKSGKVRIQFNNVTIVQEYTFNPSNLDMIDFELWIVRTSNTSVSIILKGLGGADNSIEYITFGSQSRSYIIPIAGLNLSTTSYSIDCDIQSVVPGDIVNNFLEVEYIKKI